MLVGFRMDAFALSACQRLTKQRHIAEAIAVIRISAPHLLKGLFMTIVRCGDGFIDGEERLNAKSGHTLAKDLRKEDKTRGGISPHEICIASGGLDTNLIVVLRNLHAGLLAQKTNEGDG